MKRKILVFLLTLALAACALPAAVFAEGKAAKIGDTEYDTLAMAVSAVPANGTQTTITLLGNASGDGIVVDAGKNIVFDLAGYIYTVSGNTVGSSGTETNGFQLMKGSTVQFTNGTLTSTAESCQVLIQNYCNLTLSNVNLDGTALKGAKYVLSNNCGNVQIIGNTSITAPEGGVAFDVYYWPSNGYTEGVSVTVNTTGTITGKIEYGCDNSGTNDVATKASLTIQNGTFNGSLSTKLPDTGITVTGGSFSDTSFSGYCEDGKTLVKDPDTGMFVPQYKVWINGTGYKTLSYAIAAAQPGDTIDLTGDITLSETLTLENNITINGNDHTVKGTNIPVDPSSGVVGILVKSGTVTLKNMKLTDFDTNSTPYGSVVKIDNGSTGAKVIADGLDISCFARDAFTFKSGAFEVKNSQIDCATAADYTGQKLTKAFQIGFGEYPVTGLIENVNITNSGSDYADWSASAIEVYNNATVTINGGSINNCTSGIWLDNYWPGSSSFPNYTGGSQVTINGTAITASDYAVTTAGRAGATDAMTLTINSGSFTGEISQSDPSGKEIIVINGGSFDRKPDSNFLAPGLVYENGSVIKPAPKPQEPWTPTPTATPAPAAGVLDSTPKTGAVSLLALPLAGLAFAGLGLAGRKRR